MEQSRDIYLVFMNAEFRGSTNLKDGFRHVYVIERQALGWLCVDPARSNMFNCILPAKFESEVMIEFERLNPEATIVHLEVGSNDEHLYPARGVMSCVSVVQYILGVCWRSVLTPHQLYNKIINNTPKHIEVINVNRNI